MLSNLPSRIPGSVIAQILTQSWRDPIPPSVLPPVLETYAPSLISLGVAGLASRKILNSGAKVPKDLGDAHRRFAVEAMFHEYAIQDVFTRCRSHQLEPILFKGWAIARLYPDVSLRPYGDIDLWVRSEELAHLYLALPPDNQFCVEPHTSFYRQYERSLDDVISRSQLVPLQSVNVRVPAEEDHLRFVCLHFLHHGGWRPLWLCDVALMIESRRENFDWDKCLAGKKKYADWIACVIGLAHQLLGANISGTPVEKRAHALPRWLTRVVLRQWEKDFGMSRAENFSFSLPRRLLNPAQLLRAMQEHWRNPVQASVEMNAKFNHTPRAIFQLGAIFSRLPDFTKQFGAEIRRT